MKDFVDHINAYASLLKEAAVWQSSDEILAPVLGTETNNPAADDYIYEFYCYLCIIVDLKKNYSIQFIKGEGNFEYNFPRKAAKKKGKPRFHAFENDELVFQICAGTMIKCEFEREKNHPDISFQIPSAKEDPSEEDLIIIMDAKFTEAVNSKLSKSEFYKFGGITDVFNLRNSPIININFDKLKDMFANCLITNGRAYSDANNTKLSKRWAIKEVENFSPKKRMKIIG
ncbi:hypothetical protein [Sphingobacterium tabacisoli]|uniref:Restriction endonuclease n=1 Tax=Sphingobacterium tabacisoli TaxID=2044855 RepID=A0ABW5L6V6_9SPHI|nr:hypothetical protein [Sphingobacterium tabacisoli]